jgi:hypothetical protein
MTNAEANAAAKKHSDPCPLSSCGSKKTYVVGLSFGGYSGCHDCGHKWGWHNAAGTSVSRAKFEERARANREEWGRKAARSRRLEAPGEGMEMATKKAARKTKKGARGAKAKSKSSAKKSTAGKRDSRIPKVGTVLKAKYKGKNYTAKVLADGFEFKGQQYKSISKVGSVIMGGKACNGYKLFGLC